MSALATFLKDKKIMIPLVLYFAVVDVCAFFNPGLAVGLLFVGVLSSLTFAVLASRGVYEKEPYLVFAIVLFVHLCAVIFIYYTGFKPFGGGSDFEGYHQSAVEISQRFTHGDFSLAGLHVLHFWPVLVGIIYIFTLPKMIVGQLFVAFLAGFSALAAYLLAVEIGASKKSAFVAGLLLAVYPSYLYFGSVLLKDTLVIPLILMLLLLAVKMCKEFSFMKFTVFFILLTALTNLRFYVAFAILFSFIICWFLLSSKKWVKAKIFYGLAIIILLGFVPSLLGYGYYGSIPLIGYLNRDTITKYREVVYAPSSDFAGPAVTANTPRNEDSGVGSSFVVSTGFSSPSSFIKNYVTSFVYSILGPFPWQLRLKRHLFFLLETIPWYILCGMWIYVFFRRVQKTGWRVALAHYRFALPLFLFVLMAFGALSLYINNFGIIVRIRMPMYIVLFCAMALEPHFQKAGQKIVALFTKDK